MAGKPHQQIKPQFMVGLLVVVQKPLSNHSEKCAQTSFYLPGNAKVEALGGERTRGK